MPRDTATTLHIIGAELDRYLSQTVSYTLTQTPDGIRVETADPAHLEPLSRLFGQHLGFGINWAGDAFIAVKLAPEPWRAPWTSGEVPCPAEMLGVRS